eukprot:6184694-Pleurochrysis_carterae.AAC.1
MHRIIPDPCLRVRTPSHFPSACAPQETRLPILLPSSLHQGHATASPCPLPFPRPFRSFCRSLPAPLLPQRRSRLLRRAAEQIRQQ